MKTVQTIRRLVTSGYLVGAALLCVLSAPATAQLKQQPRAAAPSHQQPPRPTPKPNTGNAPHQEHLSQWMQQRSQLNPQQQQHALQQEPGFHHLPAETQQRMMNRLQQLNQMPPEQRQRIIDRNEAMEHLSPQQRTQVKGAMQQLGGLPVDRRRAVAKGFRDLREMPTDQRAAALNSPEYRMQYSDEERGTLNSLIQAEPYIPR